MTKTFIIFPEGYDPVKADGPPDDDYKSMGMTWTPEDTERCRQMEYEVEEIVSEAEKLWSDNSQWRMVHPIVGRYVMQITKEEYLKSLPIRELNFEI